MIAPRSEPRLIDAALCYAARGQPVFPLAARGKMPMIPRREGGRGYLDATTHRGTVMGWWTRWPRANIGVVTGAASGFDVLDVDPKNGGTTSLARLVAEHGALPLTLTANTGSGGTHHVFRHVRGVRRTIGFRRGLDYLGDGGYVVAPPSVHPGGGIYRWRPDLSTVADAPAWLLPLVAATDGPASRPVCPRRTRPEGSGGSHYGLAVLRRACEDAEGAGSGCRHVTLRRRARTVAGFVAGSEIEEALARDCLEEAGLEAGLPLREVRAVLDWAFASGLAVPLRAPEGAP